MSGSICNFTVPALVAMRAQVSVVNPALGTQAEVRQRAVRIVGMEV